MTAFTLNFHLQIQLSDNISNLLVIFVESENFRKSISRLDALLVNIGFLQKSTGALLVALGNQEAINGTIQLRINLNDQQ